MNEIEVNSKPRRAQGGQGLLSHSIPVQRSQEIIPLILGKKRGRTHEREREGAPGDGAGRSVLVLAPEVGVLAALLFLLTH